MKTILGYRETPHLSPEDLPAVLSSLIDDLTNPPFSDEAFIEAADDPEAYRAELVSRLAYLPLFEDVDISVEAEGTLPLAMIDRERFSDEVAGVLEDMVASGTQKIRLTLRRSGDAVGLLIRGSGPLPARRLRFYRRKLGLSGAVLAVPEDGAGLHLLLRPAPT